MRIMAQHSNPAESDSESSTSDLLNMQDEEGWEDLEDDEITETFVSLFDNKSFASLSEMLRYCKDRDSFDIWQLQKQHSLDFLGLVKLVNYVRRQVQQGVKSPDLTSKSLFDDELNLLPVLENDAVLHNLEEILQDARDTSVNEVEELRDQLTSLQTQFDAYREDVQTYLNKKLESDSTEPKIPLQSTQNASGKSAVEEEDSDYFKSYSYNSIHEYMLKDKIRTDAYRDFIYDNKDLFSNKVVLDVGCGTGILSMFCAKAGAKMVIAVDNSAIIERARTITKDNNLADKVVCIRGRIEDVQLPVDKVDIIVSEWMGYCLLYESMLDSVIYARDKYLVQGGLMVPSHATIRLAPLADTELRASHVDFWKDVYGFDMSSMAEKAEEETLMRIVDASELADESISILNLNLHLSSLKDLKVNSPFKFEAKREVQLLEGFVIWFDIFFMRSPVSCSAQDLVVKKAKEKGIVSFSTGPDSIPTHWQQGICLIKEPRDSLMQREAVSGHVKFRKRDGHVRSLDIDVDWEVSSRGQRFQTWILD